MIDGMYVLWEILSWSGRWHSSITRQYGLDSLTNRQLANGHNNN
jgi:hypothetical protein